MKFLVRLPTGMVLTAQARRSDRLMGLAEAVEDREGTPVALIQFAFAGHRLDLDRRFSEFGFLCGRVVDLQPLCPHRPLSETRWMEEAPHDVPLVFHFRLPEPSHVHRVAPRHACLRICDVSSTTSSAFGFRVGGSFDANNFRLNLERRYLPQESSVQYEGVFGEYFFDMSSVQETSGLSTGEESRVSADIDPEPSSEIKLRPVFSTAISRHPLSGQSEIFCSLGLDATVSSSAAPLQRPRLDMCLLVDRSGSMGCAMDEYYYDGTRSVTNQGKSKLGAAGDISCRIVEHHMRHGDMVSMMTFDDCTQELARACSWEQRESVVAAAHNLAAGGGTNLNLGMREAVKLMQEVKNTHFKDVDCTEVEHRIIVLTDDQPNFGFDQSELREMVTNAAKDGIHFTFVGIGADFNSNIVGDIAQCRGAMYVSVKTTAQLLKRLDEEFDFMVTPLLHDVELSFKSDRYRVEGIYGNPDADAATGRAMHIESLFPSPKNAQGEVKGGVVLLKLGSLPGCSTSGSDGANVLGRARITYKNRAGATFREEKDVVACFGASGREDVYGSRGIRKAILLQRYVALLREWLGREGKDQHTATTGERKSAPLRVGDADVSHFRTFREHFTLEMGVIGDTSLGRDDQVLERLASWNPGDAGPSSAETGNEAMQNPMDIHLLLNSIRANARAWSVPVVAVPPIAPLPPPAQLAPQPAPPPPPSAPGPGDTTVVRMEEVD